MPAVCAEARCGVVLMHTRGRPDEWRTQPQLEPMTLIDDCARGLEASLATRPCGNCAGGNRYRSRLRIRQALRRELFAARAAGRTSRLGRPLLAGLSRKSFLGHALAPLHGGRARRGCSARDCQPCGDGGGDSARSVDRARARCAARGRSGADCRCDSRRAVVRCLRGVWVRAFPCLKERDPSTGSGQAMGHL